MKIIMASSDEAKKAYILVRNLQKRFADKLSKISCNIGEDKAFEEVTWLRDEGVHGGGSRFESRDATLFNTGSVNVSQVHYDEIPQNNLKSATAISTIIHPKNPLVPSIHIHISLTELRDGSGYWRLMGDLNPSNYDEHDKNVFDVALSNLSGDLYEEGSEQAAKYFNIPALGRHRGVSHFYLEDFTTENKKYDYDFALSFGEGVIDSYIDIITNAMKTRTTFTDKEFQTQLEYHTLYLFQVLTLDRGTTSGLMVHTQNDIGIMGSLPSHIDRDLLQAWSTKVQIPQDKLVLDLVECIGDDGAVDEDAKVKLANAVREHYKKHPEALKMQASGDTIPTTVLNHTKG